MKAFRNIKIGGGRSLFYYLIIFDKDKIILHY